MSSFDCRFRNPPLVNCATTRGAPACHAAVVARALGKLAVVRATGLVVDVMSIRTLRRWPVHAASATSFPD
ncbi:PEP-utilizing enzyme [Nocardia rhamnosiphila]